MHVGISPNLQLRDALWNKDKLIRFWDQMVKCQSHEETEYCQK